MRRTHISILFIVSCVMLVFLLAFVSAGVGEVSNKIITGITEALSPLFGAILGDAPSSEFFFAKVLIVILIVAVVYAVLSASGVGALTDHTWVLWTVSVIVAVLGVRFLTNELVQTIALPNSAFAVAVSAGIPFVLFFIMIRGFPEFAKRIAWVFFALIFLGLWALRYDKLGDAAFIYPLTAAIAIIMMFFEGIIQKYVTTSRMNRAQQAGKGNALNALNKLITDAHDDYAARGTGYVSKTQGTTVTGDRAIKADVKEYQRRIRALMRS